MALGSIFVSALLLSFEQAPPPPREREIPPRELAESLTTDPLEAYHTKPPDLEGMQRGTQNKSSCSYTSSSDFAHTFLDLLIQYAQNPSANTSPSTPSSPSPNLPVRDRNAAAQQPQYPYKPDQLIRLKIAMREKEHPPRQRRPLGNSDPSALYSTEKLRQNEETVRFLFFPPGFEGNGV